MQVIKQLFPTRWDCVQLVRYQDTHCYKYQVHVYENGATFPTQKTSLQAVRNIAEGELYTIFNELKEICA